MKITKTVDVTKEGCKPSPMSSTIASNYRCTGSIDDSSWQGK